MKSEDRAISGRAFLTAAMISRDGLTGLFRLTRLIMRRDRLRIPIWVGGVAALIVIHRHRANLGRILAGTERRVGQRLS